MYNILYAKGYKKKRCNILHFMMYNLKYYSYFYITLLTRGQVLLNILLMGNFVKLTTRNEDGSYLRTWVHADSILGLSQDGTQASNNEGSCDTVEGDTIELVAFNETIDSLS